MLPVSLILEDFEEFSSLLVVLSAPVALLCNIQWILWYLSGAENHWTYFTVRTDQNLFFLFLKVFLQNFQYFF